MIGDLSVRPAPGLDPPASVRPAAERPPASPATGTGNSAASAVGSGLAGVVEERSSIERLRSMLTDPDLRVQTQHDPASGRSVMRFQVRATGETVEQIPSEALLKLYAAIRGPLIDKQA